MSQPIDAPTGAWTYSEYARLPDDGHRYEVLDGGVLATPAPSPHHQKVIPRLAVRLPQYVEGPGGRAGITDRGVEGPPALVVEVLSPSSGAIDRVKKPRRHLDFGVPAGGRNRAVALPEGAEPMEVEMEVEVEVEVEVDELVAEL